MLASEPHTDRGLAGAGISVRVNGTPVDQTVTAKVSDSVERLSGNRDKGDSSSEWAKTTITWCSGAQRNADGSFKLKDNNSASSSLQTHKRAEDAPQLVHVIQIKPTTVDVNNKMEKVSLNELKSPTVQIKTNGAYVNKNNNNMDYTKGKISVMVGSPMILKAEDERSSSGASSAPGSDCDRSDSDREADDGTDSGFSHSRSTHRARVIKVKVRKDSSDSSNGDIYNGHAPNNEAVCKNGKNNVRLTISSYSDNKLDEAKQLLNKNLWDMQFHMRELDKSTPTDKKTDSEDIQTKINAALSMLQGKTNGTFTLRNRVRSSIVSLLVHSNSNRNYDQEEVGRIVFYTTSMGIVRTTFERCRKVKKILDTLMVKFEERDVFMNRGFQQEIKERLGITRLVLPQLFIEGRHLGSAEVIEQLNEIGHLRELLRPYKKSSVGGICQQCGGYQYLLCNVCGGSKKSVTHRHHFSEDLVALRCSHCDDSGLLRCQMCITGEIILP